jgi:hypothetical protein
MERKNKYPSKEMTFDWVRTAPEQLSQVADALDAKILGIFSISCLIISITPAIVGDIQCNLTLIPFVIAIISFLIILIKSLIAINPQKFYIADSPKILREDFWKLEPDKAKEQYWIHLEESFQDNYEKIKIKGKALAFIIWLLAIETLSMVIWLLL